MCKILWRISLLCFPFFSIGQHIIWDFDCTNPPSQIPNGWINDSQRNFNCDPLTGNVNLNTESTLSTFTLGGETGCGIKLLTHRNSEERQKIATSQNNFTTGTYIWRVWIPEFEENHRVGIGAFLYDTDDYEIDWEIGYGLSQYRAQIPNISNDYPIAYLVLHEPGPQEPTIFNPELPGGDYLIRYNQWYTLTIGVREDMTNNNNFIVDWFIQELCGRRIHAHQVVAPYNENSLIDNEADNTRFNILCSLENLCQYGTEFPDIDNSTYFDYVEFFDGPDPSMFPNWDARSTSCPFANCTTPEIFVSENLVVELLPVKGKINQLNARLSNLGNEPATGVQVRFYFAPDFPDIDITTDLKQIGNPLQTNLDAFDELTVSTEWNLKSASNDPSSWPSGWDQIEGISNYIVTLSIEHSEDQRMDNNLGCADFVASNCYLEILEQISNLRRAIRYSQAELIFAGSAAHKAALISLIRWMNSRIQELFREGRDCQ